MSGGFLSRYLAALPLLLFVGVSSASAQSSSGRTVWRYAGEPSPRGAGLLRREMLAAHNDARAYLKVPLLAWSERLAGEAMAYAEEMARTRRYQHSTRASRSSAQGENLWMGPRETVAYADMAAAWINERRWYMPRVFPDISTTGRWTDVGHYTQIIWRSTTHVGCAMASNAQDDYLVCRYSPPGNVFGQKATAP